MDLFLRGVDCETGDPKNIGIWQECTMTAWIMYSYDIPTIFLGFPAWVSHFSPFTVWIRPGVWVGLGPVAPLFAMTNR